MNASPKSKELAGAQTPVAMPMMKTVSQSLNLVQAISERIFSHARFSPVVSSFCDFMLFAFCLLSVTAVESQTHARMAEVLMIGDFMLDTASAEGMEARGDRSSAVDRITLEIQGAKLKASSMRLGTKPCVCQP